MTPDTNSITSAAVTTVVVQPSIANKPGDANVNVIPSLPVPTLWIDTGVF